MQVMTEDGLRETLSLNIKKYRKGRFTQESLAEAAGISAQNVNDIEGKRRWPREATLVKIAAALGVEVYQLFVPQDFALPVVEDTPENEKLRHAMQSQLVADFRNVLNRTLDKWEAK